ncbi:DUF3306 domain-containing protein [Thiomonas sp. FB-Cd]|uniref:DUF3306 domain-containing protein n=1 Tax=Thiomonas sp. FB-Cd TaxID=1158292 RepID=UPI00068C39C6|nr:DUF3306 domain-containing protein [Thiomonas sp. FB-Cd]
MKPPDREGVGHAAGVLARWSRRKLQAQSRRMDDGATRATGAAPVHPSPPAAAEAQAVGEAAVREAPTMQELESLDHSADLRRFIAREVDESVRCAALRKIFQDPRFNVMDGLDTYIDDYNVASPVPVSMLDRLRHAASGVVVAQPDEEPPATGPAQEACEQHGSVTTQAPAANDGSVPGAGPARALEQSVSEPLLEHPEAPHA